MIKTEAIILKSDDSNEVDRTLTVYSEKLGKIKVSAKGVKKVESKLRYSIEPISYVGMILVEGKNFLILKDAIIIDQFLKIKKEPEKIRIAKELCGLTDEAIMGEECDEDIWKLVVLTLKSIDEEKVSLKSVISDFQKNLIKLLGYNPEEIRNLNEIY
jgi:DNA repair protein RecO (recombination protein O)